MATSRNTDTDTGAPGVRRRGPELERAILDAALEQLGSVGWTSLTMEGVATRARTGKAAVYRRWPSKGDLVADALRAALPDPEGPPDRGSLREDLIELGVRLLRAMYSPGGCALRALIDECDRTEAERFIGIILGRAVEPGKRMIGEVVRRGIARGEVRPDAEEGECLVADVMPALMLYRHKVTGAPVAESDITEIVDRVMMPLLGPRTG
ncbi:TetR/AcrR family transcriptional regulator [Streptomyces sp. TRM 70361]|uniref:TetR/AcrR family transcriptional regulator n=1 Tax=Streptomyces sp. TRM 70361 TaxID=3116553 RepID=UPI002E7AC9DB|nr:TetR/AcrR family transcriptional regulator [Streptomyces sp. TRM 70361]MEE1940903.1 TetR/AcrR family transcriptional regulator [Streptomyces sp. TRM 70361]